MSVHIELLAKLVGIPSVNPVYGGPGEADLEAFVGSWLSEEESISSARKSFPGGTIWWPT